MPIELYDICRLQLLIIDQRRAHAGSCTDFSAGELWKLASTLWWCESKAQGRKAIRMQAATTTGVYTRANRMTSVSSGDCSAAALLTSSAMRATVLSLASAVVWTCKSGVRNFGLPLTQLLLTRHAAWLKP